jgi:hypothetical protein
MDVEKVGTPSELNATHGLEGGGVECWTKEGIRIKRLR